MLRANGRFVFRLQISVVVCRVHWPSASLWRTHGGGFLVNDMNVFSSKRGLRQCAICGHWKNPDKFSGNHTTCRKCAWHPPTPAERKEITGYLRADSNNHRANRWGADGTFTDDEWQSILEEYGYRCLACGTSKSITVDHIVPLSQGGSNTIDNIQPLCIKCNMHKGTHLIDYRWRAHEPVE